MLHNILQFGFAGIAGLCLLGAWLSRAKRGALLWAAVSAGAAAISAHYYVFWSLALFALVIPWALLCAGPWIDMAWRVKAGLTLFIALGSVLCIYPTYHDERHGREEHTGISSEERAELETKAQRGELGFGDFLRANIPFRLVRGLDLKGGLRLVYTVDVDEAIKDKRDRYYDDLRVKLATLMGYHQGEARPTVEELQKLQEKLRIEKARDRADTMTLIFKDRADSEKLTDEALQQFKAEMQVLWSSDLKTATFRIRDEVESQIRERAVSQAKETVERRVDALGLKEAGVTTRDEDIIIEVPGEDERAFDEIRDIISQTARLEFKMVDDDSDFFEPIARSQKREDLPKGLDFRIENAPIGPNKTKPNYYALMLRGEHEDMRDALKRLQDWVATLQVPQDNEVGFSKYVEYDEERDVFEEIGWRTYFLFSKAEVTGDMIRDAQAVPDQGDRGMGGWYVRMELTPVGGDRFEEITGKNIKRRFAIILDAKVESAPVIQTKIPGGIATITMGAGDVQQQLEDARKLELVLRSGALPAPISLSNEQRIGPTLGRDAISESFKGAIGGGSLVLLFMLVYYRRAGVIADLAVVFNLFLQVAVLAMFGASMTLPGMAGLALTMGIAIDANVLINERIREELRAGKSPRAAVDVGYDKAFSAILDGHVTTFITGLILAQYGTGPIKGFAITLIIGIAVSLFTGVVCTRLMFDWAVRHRKVKKLSVGIKTPASV
ncbi:protein translocase subunit SecD [Chondromyces apiculatus]|uniref:Protein translocase subunit SecD n=1 Tax=Chondromyces apiculatus DSM 436 TaxID=1192034 RepID=A0A017TFE6_9BACT|nr:protein translocase subunit SecD [Chondromyces apiculatus]EYF07341.1 Protein-export membrane protein SecD [Chondromyces apiculatus DSM 436]